MTAPHWTSEAVCAGVDTELFYKSGYYAVAQNVCYACPVWRECRFEGMGERFGVFGGLTAKERIRLRKRAGVVTGGLSNHDGRVEAGGPATQDDIDSLRVELRETLNDANGDLDEALLSFPSLAMQPEFDHDAIDREQVRARRQVKSNERRGWKLYKVVGS